MYKSLSPSEHRMSIGIESGPHYGQVDMLNFRPISDMVVCVVLLDMSSPIL